MKKALFIAVIFASLVCFFNTAFTQSPEFQLKKGTFVFKLAYDAAHSFELVSHNQESGEDSGAYQNYISKLEDKGLVNITGNPKSFTYLI